MENKPQSLVDSLISGIDQTLRSLQGVNRSASRPLPSDNEPETESADNSVEYEPESALDESQRLLAGRLMRVNHAGEVAAQALYQGQALAAQDAHIKASMLEAATEESDHLAWCETRLNELQCHTSALNPLWYAGSFAIGYAAGLAGNPWSLGFVGETERQVVDHLDRHLQQLPSTDQRSRKILETMKEDEARHGSNAMAAGGRELPTVVKSLMRLTSRVMTRSSYWI